MGNKSVYGSKIGKQSQLGQKGTDIKETRGLQSL